MRIKKRYILIIVIIVVAVLWIRNNINFATENIDYIIELDRFGIENDNSNATKTTEGINKALEYAKNEGYKIVKLPEGHYAIDTSVISPIVLSDGKDEWTDNRKGIVMQSDINLILTDTVLQAIATDDPYYSIFTISNCSNSKIIGGTILGDREGHNYGIRINNDGNQLEQGSFDQITGLPIEDSTKIRTKDFINNFNGEKLPEKFVLTVLENTTRNTVEGGIRYIYCYDINEKYLGIAEGGNGFLSKSTLLPNTDKIKISFNNEARLDAKYYITEEFVYPTHEFGTGITITASTNIEINGVTIKNTIGDCIGTSAPPINVTVDNLSIIDCTLENSRRQGISFVATGENYLIKGCNIGKINGVDPQSGIDIEHYNYVKNIIIEESNFYENKKWDIINYNGYDIEIKNSNFTGGIASTYGYNMNINNNTFKYSDEEWLDKTFKGVLFALNTDNEEGYFRIYNNKIDGYNAVGNVTSNLSKSEFKNNIIKNSIMVIGSNAEGNYYEDSTVRYSLYDYEYKDESFLNCIIGGENNGDSNGIRYYTNFEMNDCEFMSGNPTIKDTVLTECNIYNSNKTFCKMWGGKYTLENCEIKTEYKSDIAFIESQGSEASFNECDMDLSKTPFVRLNYGEFTMKNCNVKFNDKYINNDSVEFFRNVYGTSMFENNDFDLTGVTNTIILPN